MAGALPPFHFRIRDNGAQVFRVADDTRSRRLDMEPVAVVNLARSEIRPQGDRALSEADRQAIEAWMAERQALDAARALDDILRTVDQLGRAAHWAQARATDAELDRVTDALLLAMHDLRSVLVRRKADRSG